MSSNHRALFVVIYVEIAEFETGPPHYMESIALVRAVDEEQAAAKVRSQNSPDSYVAGDGGTVSWRILKIVDSRAALYDDFSEDVVDLYARGFKDWKAYRVFERQTAGEEE